MGQACCTGVVHVPAVPMQFDGNEFEGRHAAGELVLATFEAKCQNMAYFATRRVETDTGRPPSDLVVILHRFVI